MPREESDDHSAEPVIDPSEEPANIESDEGLRRDRNDSLPHGLVRIAFVVSGAACMLFCIAGLVLDGWGIHDVWATSPAEQSPALAAILVGVFGAWLLRLSTRPKGPATHLVLALALVLPVLLVFQLDRSRRTELDDAIVRNGRYDDICPDHTIGELMDHHHGEVEWFSYLNKYGYRSVMVVCDGSRPTPAARLIWSIDENDRFWVQYAERDGVPVDPYGLLATLCPPMTRNPASPAGG